MSPSSSINSNLSFASPTASPGLLDLGLTLAGGATHISRTIMLSELETLLAVVPEGSGAGEYADAIIQRNVLKKGTDSTRHKTLRHLRELYALNEDVAVFKLLRRLHAMDPASLPLLAIQIGWSRDHLLRASTPAVLDATEGGRVEAKDLSQAVYEVFADQYSPANIAKIGRNTGSSWTQSGHLLGRTKKTRQLVKPSAVATTMALFLGDVAGFHGAAVFSNPWCRLLDLTPERAKATALEAHRAGLLDLRMLGEVVDLSFPMFAELKAPEA